MLEQAYADYSGGSWELFTYSEGRTVLIMRTHEKKKIEDYCRKYGYSLTWTSKT